MSSMEQRFEKIGAKVKVVVLPTFGRGRIKNAAIRIDIRRDADGAYFDVQRRADVTLEVADVAPSDRHLLLIARERGATDEQHGRFLCGFDERSWFTAAVPESAAANSVQEAKDALKPEEVWDAMREWDVPMEQRDLRCTAGFVRQGEWFFLPRPWMEVYEQYILHREPIQRGAGKPHICERLHRREGVEVWVCDAYPNGLTDEQYVALDKLEREQHDWRRMERDADVFVHGYVQHPDHETIVLPYWHKVVMNTETRARAMEDVAFLD